jgi:hypothetical protein
MRVNNAIPLGCSLLLPVDAAKLRPNTEGPPLTVLTRTSVLNKLARMMNLDKSLFQMRAKARGDASSITSSSGSTAADGVDGGGSGAAVVGGDSPTTLFEAANTEPPADCDYAFIPLVDNSGQLLPIRFLSAGEDARFGSGPTGEMSSSAELLGEYLDLYRTEGGRVAAKQRFHPSEPTVRMVDRYLAVMRERLEDGTLDMDMSHREVTCTTTFDQPEGGSSAPAHAAGTGDAAKVDGGEAGLDGTCVTVVDGAASVAAAAANTTITVESCL